MGGSGANKLPQTMFRGRVRRAKSSRKKKKKEAGRCTRSREAVRRYQRDYPSDTLLREEKMWVLGGGGLFLWSGILFRDGRTLNPDLKDRPSLPMEKEGNPAVERRLENNKTEKGLKDR